MKRFQRVILLVLVALAFVLCVVPFLVPVSPLRNTVPPRQLADPDSRFVSVNGLEVHYESFGQGEPVLVLLHGLGASTWSWREVMLPLSQFGTVIAFDRPAFGLTARPLASEWEGENPYTAEAQARLTVGLLDALGIPKAILVGHSAGGSIATLTALRFPERVQALVLVSPAIYEGGGAPAWVRPLLRVPQVQRLGPLLVRLLISRLEGALPSAWHDPGKIRPEVIAGYKKPLQAENWDRAFWEFLMASRPLELDKHLDEIVQPALVITGDDDRWVPSTQSVRLAEELPNAELVVIPNCGHLVQEECPEAFLQAVTSFLSRLR
ncbi:MAG: alpha/beta hydrolase [Chloroflexi bacterium]|nr:alpha/beta hydrolase [Chloroflexota bacterium]